jgi:tRNA (guanine-N7-)-methyltransferase
MKPRDLKRALTFEERRPLLHDHIFYVPVYYSNYSCFALDFSSYFGNDNPLCIEYCSGNGDWVVQRAQLETSMNWIAVERRFERVKKIWSKLKNHALTNLLIVFGEALIFTQHYVKSESIDEAYINFPDPWPKAKHAKNRLIQLGFINELARILHGGKKMTIVTDDLPYVKQTVNLFCNHLHFSPNFCAPYYMLDLPGYGNSWFENLWKEQGKQIHYTQFIKNASG